MARVTYVQENVTHDWLRHLAQQPGEVWIENHDGELVIVHEFNDLKGEIDELQSQPCVGIDVA